MAKTFDAKQLKRRVSGRIVLMDTEDDGLVVVDGLDYQVVGGYGEVVLTHDNISSSETTVASVRVSAVMELVPIHAFMLRVKKTPEQAKAKTPPRAAAATKQKKKKKKAKPAPKAEQCPLCGEKHDTELKYCPCLGKDDKPVRCFHCGGKYDPSHYPCPLCMECPPSDEEQDETSWSTSASTSVSTSTSEASDE